MGKCINRKKRFLVCVIVFVAKFSAAQYCVAIQEMCIQKFQRATEIRDSLISACRTDINLMNLYEDCLSSNLNLISSQNKPITISFIKSLNEAKANLLGINKIVYNSVLLKYVLSLTIDNSKDVRHSANYFFGEGLDYFKQLLDSNRVTLIEILKQQIQIYFKDEEHFITPIREFKIKELSLLLKEKYILNKASGQNYKDKKELAFIACYTLGDKNIFSLYERFIREEEDLFKKYQQYNYLISEFNSENERKLLIEILRRKDVLTDMNEAERTNLVMDNYFTGFIFHTIPLLYKDFRIDNIENECAKKNKFNGNNPDEKELQSYYSFRKKCLYDQTVKWFKSRKIMK